MLSQTSNTAFNTKSSKFSLNPLEIIKNSVIDNFSFDETEQSDYEKKFIILENHNYTTIDKKNMIIKKHKNQIYKGMNIIF